MSVGLTWNVVFLFACVGLLFHHLPPFLFQNSVLHHWRVSLRWSNIQIAILCSVLLWLVLVVAETHHRLPLSWLVVDCVGYVGIGWPVLVDVSLGGPGWPTGTGADVGARSVHHQVRFTSVCVRIGEQMLTGEPTHQALTEHPVKSATKPHGKGRIEDKVDRTVDHHQQIEHIARNGRYDEVMLLHLSTHVQIGHVQVLHGLRHLTNEEHNHDNYQHHSDLVLFFLLSFWLVILDGHCDFRHDPSLFSCSQNSSDQQCVEHGEAEQRNEGKQRLIGVDVAPLVRMRVPEVGEREI